MAYRVETTSVEGFVQQIACCYLRHSYWFYVAGVVPLHKNPEAVDAKLLTKYGIGVSEATRMRRKRAGQANLQLLRHGRFFVILATQGRHPFFKEEEGRMRDFRVTPLRYAGYAISYRRGGRTRTGQPDSKWHAHVEIEREAYLELRASVMELVRHRRAEDLAQRLYALPFERYAPVRRQLSLLLRRVNDARRFAGYAPVPSDVLGLRRRVVRPFAANKMKAVGEAT